MDVVHVDTSPQDLHELSQRMSAFGKAVLVRRQVAGDNGRTKIGSISCAWPNIKREGRTEGGASSEVLGGVGLFRLLAKEVRIVIHQEIEVRRVAGGVTKVAIVGCVDQIPVPTADRRLLAVRPAGLGRQSVEHEFAYRGQVLGRDRVHIGGSLAESR